MWGPHRTTYKGNPSVHWDTIFVAPPNLEKVQITTVTETLCLEKIKDYIFFNKNDIKKGCNSKKIHNNGNNIDTHLLNYLCYGKTPEFGIILSLSNPLCPHRIRCGHHSTLRVEKLYRHIILLYSYKLVIMVFPFNFTNIKISRHNETLQQLCTA